MRNENILIWLIVTAENNKYILNICDMINEENTISNINYCSYNAFWSTYSLLKGSESDNSLH